VVVGSLVRKVSVFLRILVGPQSSVSSTKKGIWQEVTDPLI
jgi:hypothetical protein